jgi:hypothetical protein
MKKLALITAALLIIPLAAVARMNSMSDDSMGVIHGQVGITIDFETRLTDSYLAITDSDGFGTTWGSQGAITLDGLSITGDESPLTNMSVIGLDLDLGTNSSNTSYLIIGLPVISGHVEVDAVKIGTSATMGYSLGKVTWGRINYAETLCKVQAHD